MTLAGPLSPAVPPAKAGSTCRPRAIPRWRPECCRRSRPHRGEGQVSLWRYVRLFRADILSAQPARLYRAWMAEFRTPFFRSYLINDPALVKTVLNERPMEFPKSDRVGEGLRPLLGRSVFLTNGAVWQRQRRIIDPAFEGGRLRDTFPAMACGRAGGGRAACRADRPGAGRDRGGNEPCRGGRDLPHAVLDPDRAPDRGRGVPPVPRLSAHPADPEPRRLRAAAALAAALPPPRRPGATAAAIRRADRRSDRCAAGRDPGRDRTGRSGHQDHDHARSADRADASPPPRWSTRWRSSFLPGTRPRPRRWAGRCICWRPIPRFRTGSRPRRRGCPENPAFSELSKLKFTRDVFREALRLYPPVPMMVRQASQPETVPRPGDPNAAPQVVLSPWHLHRHERLWDNPRRLRPRPLRHRERQALPARGLYAVQPGRRGSAPAPDSR